MESWELSPHYFETMHHFTQAWNCFPRSWTIVICFFPPLLMCVLCLNPRDGSMSHSMSCSIFEKIDSSRVFFSSRCHVGWSSQSKTTRQDGDWINVHLKCNLGREDCVSCISPSFYPMLESWDEILVWWGRVVTSLVLVCSRLALHVCIMYNFSNELEMGTDQTLAPDQIK